MILNLLMGRKNLQFNDQLLEAVRVVVVAIVVATARCRWVATITEKNVSQV
jgi:hypothetical protein